MVRAGGWGSAEAREAKEATVLEAILRGKDDSRQPTSLADLNAMLDLDASTIGFAVESLCLAELLERVDGGAAVRPTPGAARFWILAEFMHVNRG